MPAPHWPGSRSIAQRHVTLRQFRYFVAVAESGSVASASPLLSIAQSALTKSLLELEAEIGSALFVRSPKGMATVSWSARAR